jgi:hypothetical protein
LHNNESHKPLIVAALAALALSGATFVEPAGAQTNPVLCSQPNEHCILVTIDKDANGAPTIHVDADELRVKGPLHVIFWRLNNTAAQSYKFASNGIAFTTPEGQAEFKCAPQGNSGILFRCTDPNKTRGRFKYAITVTGAPPVPVLDPWIINQ